MEYSIFHLDLDSFFASAEMARNPKLNNKPLVVVGKNNSSIISSSNYIARKMGIFAAMPLIEAKKICKNIVIINVDYNYYLDISTKIYLLLKNLFHKVEIGSIDEWYFSTKNTKFFNWSEEELAYYIKCLIKKEFNINSTIGCSWNKFLAKMATNIAKPDGFQILSKENFKEKIYNFDVKKIFFVGNKTAKILNELGIKKIKDIYEESKNDLKLHNLLGVNWITIKNNIFGIGNSEIKERMVPTSIGRSHTLTKIHNKDELKLLFIDMAKSMNKNLYNGDFTYKNIVLKIKTKDKNIYTFTKKYNIEKKWINDNDLFTLFDSNFNYHLYDSIFNIGFTLTEIKINILHLKQQNMFEIENNEIENIITNINNKFNKKILFKAIDINKMYYKSFK